MWSNQDVRGFPPFFVKDDETRGFTQQDEWWAQCTSRFSRTPLVLKNLLTDELLPRAPEDGSV